MCLQVSCIKSTFFSENENDGVAKNSRMRESRRTAVRLWQMSLFIVVAEGTRTGYEMLVMGCGSSF